MGSCKKIYLSWFISPTNYSDIYKSNKLVDNFEQILQNIFLPLFEATNDPKSHPELHKFLCYVTGFDSVDDESKPETAIIHKTMPLPKDWTSMENPPYNYYLYYMYTNMCVLNHFRRYVHFASHY